MSHVPATVWLLEKFYRPNKLYFAYEINS